MLFDQHVDGVKEPVPKDLLRPSGEVGHLDKGSISVGRNNASNEPISLTQFDCLAGAQPGFQAPGIAELANIHGRHGCNVPHNVAQRQGPR
jgi:hypothetical protein